MKIRQMKKIVYNQRHCKNGYTNKQTGEKLYYPIEFYLIAIRKYFNKVSTDDYTVE